MKYSRQRELIRQTVMQNPIHPTADTVYAMVRELEPSVSLGTVYRNLNLLAGQGELLRISLPGASDHFDGNTDPHHHLLCERCGNLYDISLGRLTELEQKLQNVREFTVHSYQVCITGLCGDCMSKMPDKIEKEGFTQ